jgi:hypothetical protein
MVPKLLFGMQAIQVSKFKMREISLSELGAMKFSVWVQGLLLGGGGQRKLGPLLSCGIPCIYNAQNKCSPQVNKNKIKIDKFHILSTKRIGQIICFIHFETKLGTLGGFWTNFCS